MRLSIAVAVACLGLGGVAAADPAQASIRQRTDIPAQALGTALQTLAKQRDFQIVCRADLVTNIYSSELAGDFTSAEALGQLLSGTNLTYRYLDDKTVTIVPMATAPPAIPSSSAPSPQSSSVLSTKSPSFWSLIRLAQAESSSQASSESPEAKGSAKPEEIVVTAERRQERLIDTPISIGVLSGRDLDRSSARGVADVLNQVGGVSLIEIAPGKSMITIRGVAPDENAGTTTAGYYLDELPFTFVTLAETPQANAYDLSRVEVLRGPQGTLYGANALSGVVRILTNDADLNAFQAKGRVRASETSHGSDNYSGDFAVNVPLIPGELAIRAVASHSELSGYIDSTGAVFGNAPARGINDTRQKDYRFKISYQPTENLGFRLGWSRSNINSDAPSQSAANLATALSTNQPDERRYDAYNLTTDYTWPSVSLLSSTSYLDYHTDTQFEILLAGVFPLNFFSRADLRSFSQELRLASHLQGPWQWTAGAIYKDATQPSSIDARPVFVSVGKEQNQSTSYAVFGETTRSFAGGTYDLTGGLRYFRDHLEGTQYSDLLFGPVNAPPLKTDFERITGRLVLAYKPQLNRTYYGSIATGFRSGQNTYFTVATLDPEFPSLDPDSLITYEGGAKGALLEGTVTYDVAVYYTDWSDIQQSLVVNSGFNSGVNAGKASGPGVDLGLGYHPNRALTLQASIGWNDLKFDEDVRQENIPLFRKGTRPNNSPQWTGSVSGNYRMATPMAGVDMVLSSNFSYHSRLRLSYLTGNVLTTTESQSMRTWNAAFGLEADRWTVSLYGDNLTDEIAAVSPPFVQYANNSARQRPRTIGLQGTFAID